MLSTHQFKIDHITLGNGKTVQRSNREPELPRHPISAKMNGSSPLLLDRFTGRNSIVKIDVWLNLFEVVVSGQPEDEKIRILLRHLSGEALNWFGTKVLPTTAKLSWNHCKSALIAHYGQSLIDPLAEAGKRIFTRADTVQSYFDDKVRLLQQCGLSDQMIVGQLTLGMPPQYEIALLSGQLTNPASWLALATQLETSFKRGTKPRQQVAFAAEDSTDGHAQATKLARMANHQSTI